ncbi:hypothetical protein HPP92_023752 [Vanilla planifolia]|nr:hypothetical protein HPP92_023752 [Vanilla planifolia]
MALKAVPILDVPTLDHLPLPSPCVKHPPSFAVIGHRGHGMNSQSSSSTRENSILSFNTAGRLPNISFVEFDVQVTSDGVPVIFHDVFILTGDANGGVSERRVA